MIKQPEKLRRTCPTCEAGCGLVVEIDRAAEQILSIKGDTKDVRSHGYVCAKSQVFQHIYEDSDRIKHPIRKTNHGWQEISWSEAYSVIVENVERARAQYGDDAVAMYVGNPTGQDFAAGLYLKVLLEQLNLTRFFTAGTVDQHPQQLACWGLFGREWNFPVPDLDNTELFICIGANPVVSQGSLMAHADVAGAVRDIQSRNGTCVVIDPRRTETAAIADEHLFIRPGTDVYFLLSFLHLLFHRNAINLSHLSSYVDSVTALQRLVGDFTPESTASVTGIDPERLRDLVARYAATDKAAFYGRVGLCTQEFGLASNWLLLVISIVAGKLDRPGCMMFSTPAMGDLGAGGAQSSVPYGRWHSKARGFPESCGELPASLMAEEIRASGDEVKVLFTVCGNPVLSVPGGDRLREAMQSLDFMVSFDIYVNETTSQADIILPSTVHAERSHLDLMKQNYATRNYVAYSPPVFAPPEGSKHLYEGIQGLAAAMAHVSDDVLEASVMEGLLNMACGRMLEKGHTVYRSAMARGIHGENAAERMADILLRTGPYGDDFGYSPGGISLESLKSHSQASIDLGPLTSRLPEFLQTPGKRIDLMHELFSSDIPRIRKRFNALLSSTSERPLLLIGRRHVRDMNSWLHNLKAYVRGKERCTMRIHPQDAEQVGLAMHAYAIVSSVAGEIKVLVEIADEMMPGVVSIPHGFGHNYSDTILAVAAEYLPGVSCNDVIDASLDLASGTSIVNGVPVSVRPVYSD